MPDFSLTLVLRLTTSKIINDVAKVQIKSEKITPFGGIFHVRELFSRFVAPIIDKVLGIRCTSFGPKDVQRDTKNSENFRLSKNNEQVILGDFGAHRGGNRGGNRRGC